MPEYKALFPNSYTAGTRSQQVSDQMLVADEMFFTPAQVVASNTTPLVIVQNSDTTKALIFVEATLRLIGGSAAYDQNQNTIIKYQTAGGGATVSTTLANWFNGAASGAMTTIKQLTTDIVPEAGQDLVITSSASPYAAAGNRYLQVKVVYYAFGLYTPY